MRLPKGYTIEMHDDCLGLYNPLQECMLESWFEDVLVQYAMELDRWDGRGYSKELHDNAQWAETEK